MAEANLNAGNYVLFEDISVDTLIITITALTDTTNGGGLAAVNAIQIVEVVPTPSAALGTAAMLGFMGLRRRRGSA